MRFLVFLFLLLLPALSFAEDVSSQKVTSDSDPLRPIFEARYAAMKSAMAARDASAISALITPDFISEDSSGQKTNADTMIKEVVALPKDPQKESTTTILTIKVDGNTATVDQRYDMKTVKSGLLGGKQNVELIAVSTDTWVKTNDTWLNQRTVTNQMDYFVDGKPVIHKVHP